MISKSEDIYDINFSYSQIGDSKSIYIKYKHKIKHIGIQLKDNYLCRFWGYAEEYKQYINYFEKQISKKME